MNKDQIDATAKAAAEIIKAVPVYEDAIQPVAKEVGKALKTVGGVINVALSPLAAMVYGFDVLKERLRTRLEEKLQNTPPENIVAPPLQLVGPLLEKYKYAHQSEELSEMFVTLLANSMDKDHVQKAHPSFVNVIAELSPDEAKLVKMIASADILPKLDIKLEHKGADGKTSGYTYPSINFTLLGSKAGLAYPDLTPSYLSNLERLNIISCPVGSMESSYSDKTHYEEIEAHPFLEEIRTEYKDQGEIKIEQRYIRITDFGKLFMDAVL